MFVLTDLVICWIAYNMIYNCSNLDMILLSDYNMGRNATNPVLGVSDEARFKPVSSAAETS